MKCASYIGGMPIKWEFVFKERQIESKWSFFSVGKNFFIEDTTGI